MKAVCGSDIGMIRDENQDRVAVEYLGNAVLAVLCDGMGGANCGSEASTLAIGTFIDHFKHAYREYFQPDDVKELLVQSVELANRAVYATSLTDDEKFGMGTTCVAALVTDGGMVHIANVGDSRAYLVTSGGMNQVTVDHNYSQYLYSIGEITKEELPFHPDRNMLVRAVGVEESVKVDYFELLPVDPRPFRILLCSDGLHGFVNMNLVAEMVKAIPMDELPAKLIELANSSGGRDNVSVAVLEE